MLCVKFDFGDREMKYPYIGRCEENELIVVFSNNGSGTTIDEGKSDIAINGKFECGFNEREFKNITAEYLANTYGEVKSKEHAEFIVKLAEVNGFEIGQVDDNPKSFMIYDNVICTHRLSHNQLSNGFNRKQITIPLPPESNVNTPEEDFEKNNGDNLIFGGDDKCKGQVPESDYNELLKRFDHMCDLHGQLSTITQLLMHDGVDVEKLINIGTDGYNMPYSKDYMDWRKHTITALTNVINIGEGKCKEWPCVGDEVLINIDFDKYDVKYGKEVDGENGVVRSIFKDGDVTVYAVSVDGTCYCFVRGLLSEAKTPAQQLQDEMKSIVDLAMKATSKGVDFHADSFLDLALVKYSITKKGK